jgi:hypothetical protein
MRMKRGDIRKVANSPHWDRKAQEGKEVMDPGFPAQHTWSTARDLIQGDGFFHQGQSWVVKDLRDHNLGRTVVVEPRKGMVGRTVMSQMQFGTPGITMEDTDERAFTFHPDEMIARRG